MDDLCPLYFVLEQCPNGSQCVRAHKFQDLAEPIQGLLITAQRILILLSPFLKKLFSLEPHQYFLIMLYQVFPPPVLYHPFKILSKIIWIHIISKTEEHVNLALKDFSRLFSLPKTHWFSPSNHCCTAVPLIQPLGVFPKCNGAAVRVRATSGLWWVSNFSKHIVRVYFFWVKVWWFPPPLSLHPTVLALGGVSEVKPKVLERTSLSKGTSEGHSGGDVVEACLASNHELDPWGPLAGMDPPEGDFFLKFLFEKIDSYFQGTPSWGGDTQNTGWVSFWPTAPSHCRCFKTF